MIDLKKIEYIRKSKSPFKMLDILIFGLVIILAIILVLTIFSSKGDNVVVTVSGKSTTYSLSRDAQIFIDGKMTVIIRGGECYVTGSACKNKTCEHMGKIKRVNQNIICAENSIIIKIVGKTDLAGSVG